MSRSRISRPSGPATLIAGPPTQDRIIPARNRLHEPFSEIPVFLRGMGGVR